MPHRTVVKGGINIPSVTKQIIGLVLISPAFTNGMVSMGNEECNKIKIESGLFGTTVHDMIEQHITKVSKPINFPESVDQALAKQCAQHFVEWYDQSELEVISAEPEDAVISKRYNFQGTWDFIGRRKGSSLILPADWKTSNQIYDTVGLQLAAYTQLYGESQGWPDDEIFKMAPDGLGVRIDKKTAKVYEHVFTGLGFYFEVFKHLIHAFEFHAKIGAWGK